MGSSKEHRDTLRIRPIEVAHIADLIRIGEVTNLSPWTAQHYLDEIKNPHSIMLRLEDDRNSTVGFVVGRQVIGGDIEMQIDAEIYNIAVEPEYQGRGHGKQLLEALIRSCREVNIVNIWLEVRESNIRAIEFYEKNGFFQVQTRKNFYNSPREHALLMRLTLKKLAA